MTRISIFLVVVATLFSTPDPAIAQEGPSRGKAFLLSLVVPGLGHRYVQGGNWDGAASLFLAADAGLWIALVGTMLRYDHLNDGYKTLASMRAGAVVEGKDRTFFLTLGTYRSSDEFVEQQLRARAWDQVDYVDSRSFQWEWQTEADFQRFRNLREDAETMRRRRPALVALLVGNRLLSGLLAIRSAGRQSATEVAFSLAPNAFAPNRPALNLQARF